MTCRGAWFQGLISELNARKWEDVPHFGCGSPIPMLIIDCAREQGGWGGGEIASSICTHPQCPSWA